MARTTCEADVSDKSEDSVRRTSRFSGAARKLSVDGSNFISRPRMQQRAFVSWPRPGPRDPNSMFFGSQLADSVAIATAPL